jgi:uncharacterized protein
MFTHLTPPTSIVIAPSEIHGWGVFAKEDIISGSVLEECPFHPFASEEDLPKYTYFFPYEMGVSKGICWGFAPLYNHNIDPNAGYYFNIENSTLIFKALKNISQGEEIFIRYRKKGEECLAPEYLGRIFK